MRRHIGTERATPHHAPASHHIPIPLGGRTEPGGLTALRKSEARRVMEEAGTGRPTARIAPKTPSPPFVMGRGPSATGKCAHGPGVGEDLDVVEREPGKGERACGRPVRRPWIWQSTTGPGAALAALLRLLDQFGAAELKAAVDEALKRDVPHSNAVRLSLTQRRDQQDKLPPIPVELPRDARMRDIAAAITISADTSGWPATMKRTAKNDRQPPCRSAVQYRLKPQPAELHHNHHTPRSCPRNAAPGGPGAGSWAQPGETGQVPALCRDGAPPAGEATPDRPGHPVSVGQAPVQPATSALENVMA